MCTELYTVHQSGGEREILQHCTDIYCEQTIECVQNYTLFTSLGVKEKYYSIVLTFIVYRIIHCSPVWGGGGDREIGCLNNIVQW